MAEDEETLRILREQAEKPVERHKGKPVVAPQIIKENIEKEGKTWKKNGDEEEDKSSA